MSESAENPSLEETEIVPDSLQDQPQTNSNYDIVNLRKPQSVADLGRECTALYHQFGMDSSRRGNFFLIEDEKLMFASVNSVVFENIVSGSREYLLAIDEAGVGCIALHPSRKLFAVGGKGFQPKIYIYSYPELKVVKVLSGGAERGYSCLNFSGEGDKLASVSMAPDFMLTVWDWQEEQMGLHSKAFGQDIYKVQFSLDDARRLTTSGIGHIRFWKMAATFTGLKLQGSIGKFGKIDLSDIDNFVELPDGKVVSGTETGSLLLWEGNFIKCRFTLVGGATCHSGNVTYLELDRTEQCLISASTDGFIRWWDFTAVDTAEVDSDHSMDFELLPIAEYRIAQPGTGVKAMLDSGVINGNTRFFVILDTKGKMQTVTFTLSPQNSKSGRFSLCDTVLSLKESQQSQVQNDDENAEFLVDASENFYVDKKVFDQFHAGPITGVDTCPLDHLAVTSGSDGTVRCVDYLNRKEVACRQFNTAATCVRWLPVSLDPTGRLVIVGFADGVVRVLGLGEDDRGKLSFLRKMVFKPHNAAVTELSFNDEGTLLATAGKDGIVFFLDCRSTSEDPAAVWSPIRFVTMLASTSNQQKAVVTCERISWNSNSSKILCSCNDGVLREVDLFELLETAQQAGSDTASFEAMYPIREVPVKVAVGTNPKTNSTAVLPSPTKTKTDSNGPAESAEQGAESSMGNESPSKVLSQQNSYLARAEDALVQVKVSQAVYSLNRVEGGFLSSTSMGQKAFTFECDINDERPVRELVNGLYSSSGAKDFLKNPATTAFQYSWSRRLLLTGTADGSVTVRSSEYLETFARTVAHNSNAEGVSFVAGSFDDRFVVSVGKDGVLSVTLVRLDLLTERSASLFKDLDAGVFGDDVVKPASKQSLPEPSYLIFVSANAEKEADAFAPSLSGGNVLSTPLLTAAEEQGDISGEAYSIQDNRLKLGEDAKKLAANELKGRVLASIKVLQKDYEKIVRENESIPEAVRLGREEMQVDGEYFGILEEQRVAMVQEVHKECAYDCEKAERLLEKVSNRLMNGLLVEEFAVSAFSVDRNARESRSIVKSLRVQSIDPSVVAILKDVQAMVRQAELKDAQTRTNETAQRKALEAVDEMKSRLTNKDEDAAVPIDSNAPIAKNNAPSSAEAEHAINESSAPARRAKRKERKEAMAKHLSQKPNEDEDDIRDLNAIRLAEKTIGDYKLKCADDYEVPEDQRINTFKKVRQMAMLEESMFTMRLQFNQRFFALRNLKRQIIYAVRRDNSRVREIDAELKQVHLSQELWEPAFDPAEFPDDSDEVTASELNQYEESRSKQSWEQAPPPKQSVTTGAKTTIVKNSLTGAYDVSLAKREVSEETKLVNFLADEEALSRTPPRKDARKFYEVDDCVLKAYSRGASTATVRHLQKLETCIPVLMAVKAATKARMQLPVVSPTQQVLNEDATRKLRYEREMILRKMGEDLEAFREAVDDLRLDRHSIIADLKQAELKLLTLFQEYKLLQTFESRDNTLQQKQIRCKGEETEIITLGNENKTRLEGKSEELQHWSEKLAQINQEFKVMLPDNHPYVETLTKIFRKKVKRSKGGGDDNEEEEEYDEEEDEDDDDEDDEEVEDICPPGCDQPLFERILDLREKKLDTEEISAEIQKSIEDLKKTIERLRQREKQIVKDAIQTEVEVQQFQLQKQAALNQIRVVVPLRISQLYMFEQSGKLTGPTDKPVAANTESGEDLQLVESLKSPDKRQLVSHIDLKSHVLFTNQNLVRLQERISELHSEIEEAKDSFRQLHRERSVLIKERESKQEEIELWSSRCLDLQMLKFGRIIDLDELEARSDRSRENEAESALREDEESYKAKAAKYSKEAISLQEKLAEVTQRNTQLLNEVAELTESQLQIARELNAPNQVVASSSKLDNFKEAEEAKRIAAYVQFQAKELQALRTELNMLKRKEAPPLMSQTQNMVPAPPASQEFFAGASSARSSMQELVLPPIPVHKR